jgi:hypothetical protein
MPVCLYLFCWLEAIIGPFNFSLSDNYIIPLPAPHGMEKWESANKAK